MAIEIERKFLINGNQWRADSGPGRHFLQAYLSVSDTNSIRVRIIDETEAWLTIKSNYRGIERDEFEYQVPVQDAFEMMDLRQSGTIEKTRYPVLIDGSQWLVDIFSGTNTGLELAEIEIEHAEQELSIPTWIGKEVTGQLRYQNSRLAAVPYSFWPSAK